MMDRRTFLGALAAGGTVALAGCTVRRETVDSLSATPEIPSGSFYHEPLRLDGAGRQLNLHYEVTADEPFDAFLFGGQSDPREFEVYRRAVQAVTGGDGNTDADGSGGETDDGQSAGARLCGGRSMGRGERSGQGSGGNGPPNRSAPPDDTGRGPPDDATASGAGERASPMRCPRPSDWHSVMGARNRGEVNRPLRSGTHHFVVDNTPLGVATPGGTLRPTIDLAVRDFELLSG